MFADTESDSNSGISMGTTIVAVEFKGGVVIGADSRTTSGAYVSNRVTNKITPLTERLFCLRSGSAADTQIIANYVRYYLDVAATTMGRCRTSPVDPATGNMVCVGLPTVKTAAKIFRELCYKNKNNLQAGIIVAGWDPDSAGSGEGSGSVYSINLGGTITKQPFALGGSGSTYIYGWCDANYRENMSKEECLEFVRKALALAMARDGSSGGVIRTVVVDKSGNEREMIPFNELPKLPIA